jgi:peptidoglycan/LPS O-acetylase OafA/YrhL
MNDGSAHTLSASVPPASGSQVKPNFTLVQAVRGIAALWVMLFHIYMGERIAALTPILPAWLVAAVFGYGSAGVGMFFVLSGFVIAHSLSGKDLSAGGLVTFIVRRFLRLDPPYWASIVLAIAVAMFMAYQHHVPYALPSFKVLLVHILYLQEILKIPEIVNVYWTLTYEIQFYLFFALSGFVLQRLNGRLGRDFAELIVRGALGFLAVAAAINSEALSTHGFFFVKWHAFFAGVLAYEAGYRRGSPLLLFILCGIMLVVAPFRDAVFDTPCAVTALVLFGASRAGYLTRGLSGVVWQFLGRISYSLYLIHVPMLIVGFGVWAKLAGRGVLSDLIGLVLVGGGILFAATLFWWGIERPFHGIATRFSFVRRSPASAQH